MVTSPNKALVFSGGCCGGTSKRVIRIGGGGCRWWLCTDVQTLDLNIMTLTPTITSAETQNGVAIDVTGVVQIKIATENMKYVETAAEMFAGKTKAQIQDQLLATMDGHLRAIIGTMDVLEIYQEREKFQEQVVYVATIDLYKLGMTVKSFTLKDITDKGGYLDSFGVSRTSQVKRDADVGKAEAEAKAKTVQGTCEMDIQEATTKLEGNIDRYETELALKKATFQEEINLLRANANRSAEQAQAEFSKKITAQKAESEILERRRQGELELLELEKYNIERKSTIDRPVEAEKYKLETESKMRLEVENILSKARAEAIRVKGDAEAEQIEALGMAEAQVLEANAEAYKQYGEAALANMIIESLPKYAAEVAAPLAKTNEVTIISGNNKTTENMANLVGTMPPAVEALTGVDITEAMQKMMK